MSIKIGDLDLSGMRLGEKEVLAAYLGEIEVYTPGPFEGLRVTKKIETTSKGGIFTIKGQSSEPWSATAPEWITLSQTSGDAGKFEIEVTIAEADDDREGSIDLTTENYSASCVVYQKKVIQQPNDEIWYWTSNGEILPQINKDGNNNYKTVWGDANLISNTYGDKGIMKFDKPITIIPHRAFWSAYGMIELSLPASITEFEGPYFNLDNLQDIEKIYFHTEPYVKSNGWNNIYVDNKPSFTNIYVPDDYIEEYREQPTFSYYGNKLTPISESL